MTRPSTPWPHFPCHRVMWPSRHVIAMSLPTCLLRHAMSLPTCLPSHPAMSFKCQLCKLVHTWTLHVWCVLIRPHVNCSSRFVVTSNFQWWCGGHVVYVGVLPSSNLDDNWLISYSWQLQTSHRPNVGATCPINDSLFSLSFSSCGMQCVHVLEAYDST